MIAAPLSSRRFELVRLLGAGGMGAVYEAVDHERQVTVALKTLTHMTPASLVRFKNEFRALQDVRQRNLVRLGELLQEDGRWFFTMELVRGVRFDRFICGDGDEPSGAAPPPTEDPTLTVPATTRGAVAPAPARPRLLPLDEGRLRSALQELAAGLAALHAAGKVHRDIKPSNVLVDGDGRVVILDFGLIAPATTSDGTDDGEVAGTTSYMAPEQSIGAPTGPAADWYSVGVMLYLILAGRLPYIGSEHDVLELKRSVDPVDVTAFRPDAPADLAALCMRLLTRDPCRRPSENELVALLGVDDGSAAASAAPPLFVGRESELDRLREAFAATRAGAVTVVVEGDSGVGKTALVRELLRWIDRDASETLVLAGRCYERESVPYKALDEIIDGLSRRLAAVPQDALSSLLPTDAHALAQSFPALQRIEPLARPPGELTRVSAPLRQRHAMFRALRDLFARLARRRPLVLWIDDLQWADADSIALLAAVLSPPDPPPMLLVATLRTSSRATAMERELPGELRRITLGPLPPDAAEQLASRLLRHRVGKTPDGDAARIASEAAGHPLYIDALVRHRAAAGDSTDRVRLDDALRYRIDQLPDGSRALLQVIVVAGLPLPQATAAAAVHASLGDLDEPLATLRAAGLVRTLGTRGSDTVEPYHDRVREAVTRALDGEVCRGLHERLAVALEAQGDADPELLAVHWRDAGRPDRAGAYARRAADDATRALAFDRAARLHRMALALDPNAADAHALRVRLGDALANGGRGRDAALAYLDGIEGASRDEALVLRRAAAEQFLRSGHVDEGTAVLRAVLAAGGIEIPRTPRRALAALLARRLQLRLRGLGFERRAEADIDPNELQRIDATWSASIGLAIVDIIRGAYFQTRNLLLALDAGEPYRIARALAIDACFVAANGGATEGRVRELLARAESLAREIGHPHAVGVAHVSAGCAAAVLGRWREAVDRCGQGERILRERCVGTAWEIDNAHAFSTWSLWFLGAVDEMARVLPERVRVAEDHGDLLGISALRSTYSVNAWLARGDVDGARREAYDAMKRWSQDGFHTQHSYDVVARAHIALYVGDGASAYRIVEERWADHVASLLMRVQFSRVNMLDLRARAAVAAAAKVRGGVRARLLRRATRDAAALAKEGVAWAEAMAANIDAALAAAAGDSRAPLSYEAAAAAFERADMTLFAAAARRRRGEILGGDAGRALVDAMDREMRARGVVVPAAMTAMLSPRASR